MRTISCKAFSVNWRTCRPDSIPFPAISIEVRVRRHGVNAQPIPLPLADPPAQELAVLAGMELDASPIPGGEVNKGKRVRHSGGEVVDPILVHVPDDDEARPEAVARLLLHHVDDWIPRFPVSRAKPAGKNCGAGTGDANKSQSSAKFSHTAASSIATRTSENFKRTVLSKNHTDRLVRKKAAPPQRGSNLYTL